MEQRSEEWFEARKGLLTASSVGGALGVAPYASRADVMRRMVREWHGAEQEFGGNIATDYGERNESGALIEYEMETGNAVQQVGFVTREDWAGASPDAFVGDDGGLEIKCPFGKRKDGAGDLAFKPLAKQPHYYAQVQFSLWVTGRAWWHFFQWAPGGTSLETVKPDDAWLAENMPKLRQFYAEYLAERDNPASDHLQPKRVVIDTPQAWRMMEEYDQITEALERADERKKELLAEMVRLAGDRNAVFAGRNLTRTERAGSISYAKAIKELLPDADLEKWRGKPSSFWGIK